MKQKMIIVLVALVVGVFTASTALAINLGSRSEEMTAASICDLAGTITLKFTQSDYNAIRAYLGSSDPNDDGNNAGTGTANAVVIRVSLGGTGLALDADVPVLCENIVGTATGSGAAATPAALPSNGTLVALQTVDVEVSDMTNATPNATSDGIPDVTAFVFAVDGAQYFTIYITDIQAASNWADANTFPWIKVGLYQELIDATDTEHTAICADVHDFGGLSLLTVSLDLTPESLTYTTADNQIGHFLVEEVELRDCVKLETCANPDTMQIGLCARGAGVGQAVVCPDYYQCFVIEGDMPPSGIADFEIRSNGAINAGNIQSGVYITSVTFMNEAGGAITPSTAITYWEADGTTVATTADCDDESEQARGEIDLVDIAGVGDELRVCVTYQIDPDVATEDTDVRFWVNFYMAPCGTIATGTVTAASLVECGGLASCIYFPYVVTQSSPWNTGIALTNLGTTVTAANMAVTFTLTDSTGTAFTYTKSDFTGTVWSDFLDNILSEFSGTPAAGPAWLYVSANFALDGYEFLTDAVFGAGTLPRALTTCGTLIGADSTR